MKAKINFYSFLLISILLVHWGYFHAKTQELATQDTLLQNEFQDSTKTIVQEKKSDLEGPVKYTAEKITFSIADKKSFLEGNVRIEYLNMQLDAGIVTIDWEQNLMKATGIADTTDSLGNSM